MVKTNLLLGSILLCSLALHASEYATVFDCITQNPINQGRYFYTELKQSSNDLLLFSYWMTRTGRYEHNKELISTNRGFLSENDNIVTFNNSEQDDLNIRIEIYLDRHFSPTRYWGNYFGKNELDDKKQLAIICRTY